MSALSIQVKDLRNELAVAKELHGNEVSAFEAEIATLTEAKAGFETKIAELTEAVTAQETALEEARADAEAVKAEREASDAKAEELQKELDDAKAALEDPAFAQVAEAGAEEAAPVAEAEEAPSIEKLKSLSGAERVAYFAEHKDALLK